MQLIGSKTILMIHGAFVNNVIWIEWQAFFEEKGYKTFAPAWPHKQGSPELLRRQHPDRTIAAIRLVDLLEYYSGIISKLPEKPILMGHALGGLLAQLLMARGLADAAIAIHSAPPRGVRTFKWSFLKTIWKPLGFFTPVRETYLMSLKHWQNGFTNGISAQEQKDSYQQFVTPESKLVIRDTLSKLAVIDFEKEHPPLLFVSGSADQLTPASLNYLNYKSYSHETSVTDYMEFEGHNHFVLRQPGWRADADYILNWIGTH